MAVRNTGDDGLGTQTVRVSAPKGMTFMTTTLTMSRSDTETETQFLGKLSTDGQMLTCPEVAIDLKSDDSGQWVALYPEMEVGASASPGAAAVAFILGEPTFAAGSVHLTIVPAQPAPG